MRAIIQRVLRGCVRVNGETISSIERGFVVLVGITDDDTTKDAEWMYDFAASPCSSGAISIHVCLTDLLCYGAADVAKSWARVCGQTTPARRGT